VKRPAVNLALGVVFLAAGVAGCGGDASPVAVQVGRTPITQASVKHWMDVIAGEVSTAADQPKPPVPTPPEYTACIAYRRKYPATFRSEQSALSAGGPKRECEFEFYKEKLKSLYFLISSQWVEGAASELGISPSSGDLRRQIAPLIERFPNKVVARRFLVGTRGTEADLQARLKVVLLTSKIQHALEAQNRQKGLAKDGRQRALDAFGRSLGSTWRWRTSCRPGYVVPICRQRYSPPQAASRVVPPDVPLTRMTAE
jgi:hypothetical protein